MSDAITVKSGLTSAGIVIASASPAILAELFFKFLPPVLTVCSLLLGIVIGVMSFYKLRRDADAQKESAKLTKVLLANAELVSINLLKDSTYKDAQIQALIDAHAKVRRADDKSEPN